MSENFANNFNTSIPGGQTQAQPTQSAAPQGYYYPQQAQGQVPGQQAQPVYQNAAAPIPGQQTQAAYRNASAPSRAQPYPYAPTQPAMQYVPYQYPNGYPIYPGNPYYYDPVLARREYEKRLKVEKAKSSLRYLGNMAGLSILLFLIFNTVMSTVLAVPGFIELYKTNSAFTSAFSIVGSFIYLFIPFTIVALLTRIKDKSVNFFPFKKMNTKRALLCIPIGLLVCLIANIITNFIVNIFDSFGVKLSQQSDSMAEPNTAFTLFLAFICTAVMPALLEEYSLRGVILQPARKYGMMFAIVSSSAIFGLMHGNLIQAPFAFIVGMCFAFLAIKCDSLWIGVILHLINNGFSVIMSFAESKMPETSFNIAYYIIISVTAVAGIACLVVLIMTDRQFFKKSEGNIAGEEAAILSAGQKFVAYFINVPMIISFLFIVLLTAQFVARK